MSDLQIAIYIIRPSGHKMLKRRLTWKNVRDDVKQEVLSAIDNVAVKHCPDEIKEGFA